MDFSLVLPKMIVFVKIGGNSLPVEVAENESVLDLAKKISLRKNIELGSFKIAFAGKVIPETTDIFTCGITDEATIHVTICLAYFKQALEKGNNKVRNLSGCEKMGIVTSILKYKKYSLNFHRYFFG